MPEGFGTGELDGWGGEGEADMIILLVMCSLRPVERRCMAAQGFFKACYLWIFNLAIKLLLIKI
ncbi:hypothetical protein CPA56_05565 [Bombella sp. TMW2.1889]|uniref:Uncharacterized protein n=1 Tax=Bombella mellum TaxID=2039288 RepID=A0ABR5ZT12_9PROT|nr:hypothetical protein [Bombella mellum]